MVVRKAEVLGLLESLTAMAEWGMTTSSRGGMDAVRTGSRRGRVKRSPRAKEFVSWRLTHMLVCGLVMTGLDLNERLDTKLR